MCFLYELIKIWRNLSSLSVFDGEKILSFRKCLKIAFIFSYKISSSLEAISFGLKALAFLTITDDKEFLQNNLDTTTVMKLIQSFMNTALYFAETKSNFFRSGIHLLVPNPRLISLALSKLSLLVDLVLFNSVTVEHA